MTQTPKTAHAACAATAAALTAALAALLTLTCTPGNDDISVSVHIPENGVSRIEANYAYVETRYSASGATITEVGVMYSITRGNLNVGMLDASRTNREVGDTSGNTAEFGVVSGLPSVSGVFGADLTGLRVATIYYVVPYVRVKGVAGGEFYKGYFVPADGYREFRTLGSANQGDAPASVSVCNASVSDNTATLSASVISIGSPGFDDRGFCYGTEPNPAMEGGNGVCVRVLGTGIVFSTQIGGLSEQTTYHARAYIVNSSHGIQYGAGTIFKIGNSDVTTFTDERDGQEYRAVEIGGVAWMAENLNFVMDGSWCYDEDEINCEKYGRLYTWGAAMEACPSGWHLSRNNEWDDLFKVTGGMPMALISNLKAGKPYWDGSDSYGFTGLPGGYRDDRNYYTDIGSDGYWWIAAEHPSGTSAHAIWMQTSASMYSTGGYAGKGDGLSVRCVQDSN